MAENPTNRAYYPFTKAGAALYNPFFKDGVYNPVLDLPVDESKRGFRRIACGSLEESSYYGTGTISNPGAPPGDINKFTDICKDGGLLKCIIHYGDVYQNMKDLCNDIDLVLVKYQVRLKDDKNTLVKDYNGDEKFVLQDGLYCPALQIAVKTMDLGERALLFVKPQYGFGDKGKPADGDEGPIPPNATLAIYLQLVSCKKITYDKTIYKEGKGNEYPNKGAVVKLKLLGKLRDNTLFFSQGFGDEEDLFEIKTDEEQVVDGLDEAVMGMKKGEVALLTIPPQYAFGSSESQQELGVVPPNSTLYYHVELVSFVQEKEVWDMNNEEKIEAARKKQEEGEALFRAGEIARAYKRFRKAIRFIGNPVSFSAEEKKIVKILWCDCVEDCKKCKGAESKSSEHRDKFFKELEESKLRNRQLQERRQEYGGIIYSKGKFIWLL